MVTPDSSNLNLYPESSNSSAPQSHKSKTLISVAILVLAILGGGLAYGYSSGYLNFNQDLPALMEEKVMEAKSAKFDATVEGKTSFKEGKKPDQASAFLAGFGLDKFSLNLKGAWEETSEGNKKFYMDLSLGLGFIQAVAELRGFDDILYAKLKEIPTLGFFDASSYKDKWVYFDIKTSLSPNNDFLMNYNALDFSEEDQKKFEEITKSASIAKILEKKGAESIREVLTYKYTFDLDQAGINAYALKVKELIDSRPEKSEVSPAFDPATINDTLNNIKNFKGEVWIGKKDKLPYKSAISFLFDETATNPEIPYTTDISMTILMSDWNKPIVVERPEGAQDLKEIGIKGISISSQKPSQLPAGNKKDPSADNFIKFTLDDLRVKAELYRNASKDDFYQGFCKSPETQADLNMINNKIKPASAVCKDAFITFLIAAPLSDDTYYCVDDDRAATLKSLPAGRDCK